MLVDKKDFQNSVAQYWPAKEGFTGNFYIKPFAKVTICGKNIKIIFGDVPVGKKNKKKHDPNKAPDEQSLLLSRKRTIQKLTDLISCNAGRWPKKSGKMYPPIFLTLTFRDEIKDLRTANRLFTEFMQNYNYRIFKTKNKILRYVAVPEFMQNGRVHYHCLIFNLPFNIENYNIATDVWGHGYVWVKSVSSKSTFGIAKYMSKYLVKACDDSRLYRKRKYFPSADLLRPIEFRGYFIVKDFLEALQRTRPEQSIKKLKVKTEFLGEFLCYYTYLTDNEELSDLLPELDQYVQNVLQSEINKEQDKLKL